MYPIEQGIIFPKTLFDEKNLTEEEIIKAQNSFRLIFNFDKNTPLDIENKNYGQLIKLLALASRYKRLTEALEYLIMGFQNSLQKKYKAGYNLIFTAISNVSIIDINDPRVTKYEDTVAQLKFGGKRFNDLSDKEKTICTTLIMSLREIYCLTQIIKSNLQSPSIQNMFNLIEKIRDVFRDLFGFQIVKFDKGDVLEPYKLLRHGIAHSHFVFIGNQVKIVHWKEYWESEASIKKGKSKKLKKKKPISLFEEDYNETSEEMKYWVAILSQIIAIYQLMQQSKKG